MTKKLRYYFILNFLIFTLFSFTNYAQYPIAVEQNLKIAGNNRPELEKAIIYCQNTKDSLKLKAIYFLIANMDIHYSADYYWENKDKQRITYNELNYSDFEEAAKAFEVIKNQNSGLQPQKIIYKDLETIKGDFLIENIEKAFLVWKNSPIKNISFESFCEYILPYRMSVEPLQNWRQTYNTKFGWITDKVKEVGLENALHYVKDDANSWFTNTWGKGGRKEPLPRLGSKQLLFRKQGLCEDLADLGVFTMRSLGIPATVNAIPFWATSTGGHLNNTFFNNQLKPIAFDYDNKEYNDKLKREPAKVLRYTYSKQPGTLAGIETIDNIPNGFLQDQNYLDVTHEYWETTDVNCILNNNPNHPKIVYVSTFNGLRWKPFWWGKINDYQTQFSKICKGTIILPQYYNSGKMIPAAPPILVGNKENRILKPDYTQLQNVTISSIAGYLLIKPQIIYKLFYWDDSWKLVGTKTADITAQSFVYEKVPQNALLLLLSSDSKGYERPFVVDKNGNRTWY